MITTNEHELLTCTYTTKNPKQVGSLHSFGNAQIGHLIDLSKTILEFGFFKP